MWGISILADFRPMGYKLSCCGSLSKTVFDLGKNLLFKSVLGHCVNHLIQAVIHSEFNGNPIYQLLILSSYA